MKSYDEIADEYANKRLIGARTKELMKNPLFKDVAELYAQQRVNEVLDKAAEVIFNTPIDKGKPDCYLGGYGDALNDTQHSILKLKSK